MDAWPAPKARCPEHQVTACAMSARAARIRAASASPRAMSVAQAPSRRRPPSTARSALQASTTTTPRRPLHARSAAAAPTPSQARTQTRRRWAASRARPGHTAHRLAHRNHASCALPDTTLLATPPNVRSVRRACTTMTLARRRPGPAVRSVFDAGSERIRRQAPLRARHAQRATTTTTRTRRPRATAPTPPAQQALTPSLDPAAAVRNARPDSSTTTATPVPPAETAPKARTRPRGHLVPRLSRRPGRPRQERLHIV